MGKFGEIINQNNLVVFYFYNDRFQSSLQSRSELKFICKKNEPEVKFITVNEINNSELCDALRINTLPTILIYKAGEMILRVSRPEIDFDYIKEILKQQ